MPRHFKRITGRGHLYFLTSSCYQRRPLLASVRARNITVQILKEVRDRYRFALLGYVIMPGYLHLLLSEVPGLEPETIIQVFKQRVSRRLPGKKRAPKGLLTLGFPENPEALRRFWQRRYFDLNVYWSAKVPQKLHYMHANPVKAKLVQHPGDWPWSSCCHYYRDDALLTMDPW
jgi:putative transposase